jgi:hypothetical protein
MPYSFIQPTALQLMQQAPGLVPGIIRIVAIYYDRVEKEVVGRILKQPRLGDIPEMLEIKPGVLGILEKTRGESKAFKWFLNNELPFEPEADSEVEMDVFLELKANVLMIPMENEYDGKSDLLYFYFTDNFSLFRMSNSKKALTTDHKSITGNLLSNTLHTMSRLWRSDRDILRDMNRSTLSVIDRYKEAQDELAGLRSGAQRNIVGLCNHLLSEIASGSSFHYSLTPAAVEKIKKFKGDIPELKIILKKAVTFASAIEFEGYSDDIRLNEYHIDLNAAKPDIKTPETASISSGRYTKTMALLDKLEEAARNLTIKDQPLTGANVGGACRKAISAPAISDALKKHKNKIITLLKQYPEKWKLIRADFKPLINVLSPKFSEEENKENSAG